MNEQERSRTALAETETIEPATRARSSLYFIWQGILSDRFALAGAAVMLGLIICAIFAPWIAPYGSNEANPILRLKGPGTEGHPLGLDVQGRDILSRLIYGTRMSLLTGFAPVIIGAVISIPLGMIAAYYARVGQVIMRVMDIFFAFPMVLLAILLAAFLGPSLFNLILALTIVLIPYNTRIVYVEALGQKQLGYVEAARATATSDTRILFVEMLPHVVSASLVYSMTVVGVIVILAAGLSFLGMGVQQPTAEWGLMTSEGRLVLNRAPHVSTLPGVAIVLLVTSANLVGDSLRDALDPRTRLHRLKQSQTE